MNWKGFGRKRPRSSFWYNPGMSGGHEENHDIPKPGEPMPVTRLEARHCRISNRSTKLPTGARSLVEIRSNQQNDKLQGPIENTSLGPFVFTGKTEIVLVEKLTVPYLVL
jgi:hypothetical protein